MHVIASIYAGVEVPIFSVRGMLHDSEVDRPRFPKYLESVRKDPLTRTLINLLYWECPICDHIAPE